MQNIKLFPPFCTNLHRDAFICNILCKSTLPQLMMVWTFFIPEICRTLFHISNICYILNDYNFMWSLTHYFKLIYFLSMSSHDREQPLWCLFWIGHRSHHGGSTFMTSSKYNYLPKALSPKTITLGVEC